MITGSLVSSLLDGDVAETGLLSKTEALPYSITADDDGYVIYLTGTGILTMGSIFKGMSAVLIDDDALGNKVVHATTQLNTEDGPTGDITISGQNGHVSILSRGGGNYYASGSIS